MILSEKITKRISLVILEDLNKHIALQLRDNNLFIANPDQWAIFGGRIEQDESPRQAALREVQEELTIALIPAKLSFLKTFYYPEKGKAFWLFHYPVQNELNHTNLTEGQSYRQVAPELIQSGLIAHKRIVDHHLEMLDWYWCHAVQIT